MLTSAVSFTILMKRFSKSVLMIDVKVTSNHTFIANHLLLLPLAVPLQLGLLVVVVLLVYSLFHLLLFAPAVLAFRIPFLSVDISCKISSSSVPPSSNLFLSI